MFSVFHYIFWNYLLLIYKEEISTEDETTLGIFGIYIPGNNLHKVFLSSKKSLNFLSHSLSSLILSLYNKSFPLVDLITSLIF